MKIVLAGAYGHLGTDVLRALAAAGHQIIAADIKKGNSYIKGNITFFKINVTNPQTLKGLCDGADCVISTVGLTTSSAAVTNEMIDYKGNLNLLNEAKSAGVRHFAYISVLKADGAKDVPMLSSKFRFEKELKASGLQYAIFRPTGYFYDIVKVFRPMIDKGEVTLLGKKAVHANVIATEDFAEFIVKHMLDDNKTYDIGGCETYSYEEIAKMCFEAAEKEPRIKRAPVFLFDMLAFINKCKKNGKEAIIKFSKWTLTNEMVGSVHYGNRSFKKYIEESFKSNGGEA